MRKHNIYQDTAAARLNAIHIIKSDPSVKHVIYADRKTYDAPMTVYTNPLVFYHEETFQKYIDTNPAEVIYVIHWNEEY